MARRTTVEVDPIILRAIKMIARHRRRKVKIVSDGLLRFAIPYEKQIFAESNNNRRDNGK